MVDFYRDDATGELQVGWTLEFSAGEGMAGASDVSSPHSGTLTFADGVHKAWVEVVAFDDTIPEPVETVNVRLSTGALGTTWIHDNDYAEGENTEDNPQFCTCPPEDGVAAEVQNQVGTLISQVASSAGGAFANLIHLGSTVNWPVISINTSFGSEATDATSIEASLNFNGTTGPSVYYNPATISPGEMYRFSLQPDTGSLASGRYGWTMEIIEHYEDEYGYEYTESRTFDGSSDIINRSESELGSGWMLRELDSMTIQSEGVQLIDGDGNDYWFTDNYDGTFTVTERIAVVLFAELWLYRFWG